MDAFRQTSPIARRIARYRWPDNTPKAETGGRSAADNDEHEDCAVQFVPLGPSNHFDKMRGNLEGFHAIRVNQQWRLIFQWDGGRSEARGVYLDDHSYL